MLGGHALDVDNRGVTTAYKVMAGWCRLGVVFCVTGWCQSTPNIKRLLQLVLQPTYLSALELFCLLQDAANAAARRLLEAGKATASLMQSLASSIISGTPSLLPKGA